jgi:predicted Zn-dependent protease
MSTLTAKPALTSSLITVNSFNGAPLLLTRTPQTIVAEALAAARGIRNLRDCLVCVGVGSSADLRWANSTLTTNGISWDVSLSVVVYMDTVDGIATATLACDAADLDTLGVRNLVESAAAKALIIGALSEGANLVVRDPLGDWDALPLITDASVFAPVTTQLGEMFSASTSDGFAHFGYAEHNMTNVWVAALSGLRAQYAFPAGRMELTARTFDGARSTWEGRATRTFKDVDLAAIDGSLRTRLEWQRRRVELDAGKYTTILPSGCVGDMIETMRGAFVLRDAVEGNSYFSSANATNGTRLGERIVQSAANLYSDPSYIGLDGPDIVVDMYDQATQSVFDAGLQAGRADWIRNGALEALAGTRVTEDEYGIDRKADCGNMILEIDGGAGSLEDLIADVEDGVLCTSLWYIRDIDESKLLVTGLTRDGVYLVKDGEVVAATNNFRFNESAVSMLDRVRAAGATEITQVREHAESAEDVAMPPLVIEGFNFSSVSTAN